MLLPRDEVPRRERVEERLLVVRRGVGREDPVLSAEHVCLGVGVPAGQDGIAGAWSLRGRGAGRGQGEGSEEEESVHEGAG